MTSGVSQLNGNPFNDFNHTLRELVASYPSAKILELGGGRSPAFALSEMPSTIESYTVNDISADELALAGPEYKTACFDVLGDVSGFVGQFDVIFSKTLIEHVKDGKEMHRNIRKLLRPNGVSIHLAPTLYSPPFVLNKYLPQDVSSRLLWKFFPNRKNEFPKFPAYYSWCYGNRAKMEGMLKEVGFSRVDIRTYYGHGYFRKVPVIKQIDAALTAAAKRNDWSSFGSFAHFIAFK